MSDGPHDFQHAADVAGQWLNEVREALSCEHQQAWHALRAGLHVLRDRMTVEETADLSAQLPVLIRGLYYEGWRPSDAPTRERREEDYLAAVGRAMAGPTVDAEAATRAVFGVLKRHVGEGQMRHVRVMLPEEVAGLLDAA